MARSAQPDSAGSKASRKRLAAVTSGGSYCQSSDGRFVKPKDQNAWRVIATDAKAGTKYKIQMDFASHTFKGQIAY